MKTSDESLPHESSLSKNAFMSGGGPMDTTDNWGMTDEHLREECLKAEKELLKGRSPTASDPNQTSEKTSHELQMERVAESLLRDGLASSIEEARKMVDEAI